MTFKNLHLASFLQEAVMQVVEKTCKVQNWGVDKANNEGLSLDIKYEYEMMNRHKDELLILSIEVTEQGLEIQATIGPAISSWADIRGAVYRMLGLISEQMLVVTQKHDETLLQFWFATGNVTGHTPHGHIGVITIVMEDVKHLDPDENDPDE